MEWEGPSELFYGPGLTLEDLKHGVGRTEVGFRREDLTTGISSVSDTNAQVWVDSRSRSFDASSRPKGLENKCRWHFPLEGID